MFHKLKLEWVVAVEVSAIVVFSTFFLPGGEDLYRYYLPFAHGCLNCGFVPYYARWILWPLSSLPPQLAWTVWTIISVFGFVILCWITKSNPAVLLLSFPAMGQFWLGQVDIIVAVGLVIGLLATNPYLRGIGIVLALVKPQLTWLAVLTLLITRPRHDLWKSLLPLFVMAAASLWVYGWSWPMQWIANAVSNLPSHVWRLAAMDFWKFGILLVIILSLFGLFRLRFETALALGAIVTPFFSVYSYVLFFVFQPPWWALPLSYAWLLSYPILGKSSMRLAWVVPVGLLGYYIHREKSLTDVFVSQEPQAHHGPHHV